MKALRLFAGAVLALASTSAFSQFSPDGPVRIVVPYGPGSTPDIAARILADKLAPRLKQPVVVDNRAGAGGNIGTDAVAKAKPDGRTIGISIAGPLAVNTLLYRNLPYDPMRDLAPVTLVATQPSVLVVRQRWAGLPAQEIFGLMRKDPGKYNYASLGAGSISHLAMEAIAAATSSHPVHVPYNNSPAAVAALLSGDVDLACLPAAAVVPHMKSGRLKALAVATAKRSPMLPDLPTLAELGIAGVQADAWMGIVAPGGTPPAIVQRYHDEIVAILHEPDVREKLRLQSMEVIGSSPEQLRAVMQADLARWKPVIERHGIALD